MNTLTLRFKLIVLIALTAFAVGVFGFDFVASGQQRQTRIDFNRDIKPILSDKCFACHGPDAATKKIKLRLDSESAALAELRAGKHAIVPNHPEQSELVRRITSKDEALRMPPVDSGRKLTESEIELLTEWIRQGARFEQHWSFIAPVRPVLPKVKNTAWVKNAIDNFVLARLEKEGLSPAPEADRSTLIRRVSLDLTGLPPSPKEVDEFITDQSPNAYEKVVDRLLASPRYGERMAFQWLNAARYADTNGYQLDGERLMWRWRDWVINAYNRNLPFDQFTIQQLAGDLLPKPANREAALDQIIATAFNRNHRGNSEDGIVPEEYRIEYVVDRVDTVSTVFLGLTFGCARCHNHKFDPLSQREYYQLSAYLNSIPEDGRASNYGNSVPWIAAPTVEQQRQLKQIETNIAETQGRFEQQLAASAKEQRRWESRLAVSGNSHWFPKEGLLLRHAMDAGAKLEIASALSRINLARPDDDENETRISKQEPIKDESAFRIGKAPATDKDGKIIAPPPAVAPSFVASPLGQGIGFNGDLYFDAGRVANFDYRDRKRDYKDNFAVSAWVYPEAEQSGAIVAHLPDAKGETDYNLPKNKGWGLFFQNGKVHFNLVSVWADDSFRVETADKLPLRQWFHVVATFDSAEPYDKVKIFINGQEAKLNLIYGRIFRSFGDTKRTLKFGAGGGESFRFKGALDEIRIYKVLPEPDQIAVLACADSLETIAHIEPAKRTRGQQLKIEGAFLESAAPDSLKATGRRLAELKRDKLTLESEFPTLMVMQELPTPRTTYVLRRGAYDQLAEPVERALPAVLTQGGGAAIQPNNRLGLARWLVGKENPLTARVQVNRFWQMLFGTGLVKTVEDFGSQGEQPSHPELLDWLAVAFRDGVTEGQRDGEMGRRGEAGKAWDVKAMLKLMVMSATYRQSSKLSASLAADNPQSAIRNPQSDDPANRLLAHGPRLRLSAEMIRDQALAASGLLVEHLGGPSVKPYQPAGLWKDMTFSNMTFYDQAKGEGLWRRSLYTFWKRTILNPAMLTFDASARELCSVREVRTNTPLQALNLMNDVTYVEASRMLAERAMLETTTPRQRLAWMFRLVLVRAPSEVEQGVLLKNLNAQIEAFRANPDEARRLLAIGERRNNPKLKAEELAAYATVASLILNLDEAITKQ